MADLHASSAMSMAGQGQGLDLAQAVHALQSTLMDFQRRNEEAQRRTEESQAAMFHALNAIITSGNGDKQANGVAAQQALDVLRNQQAPSYSQQSLLSQASGLVQGKSGTQKQLLHLLQALQTNSNGPLSDNLAEQVLSSAAQAHSSPFSQRSVRRPMKQSNGHSSPTLGSYRSSHDYMHSNGVQSSPVAQQKKRQSSAAATRKAGSQSRARFPLATGSSSINAQSPILGGLTPGYEADYLSGPSPTYSAGPNARESHSASIPPFSTDGMRLTNKENQRKPLACCYNCGETNEKFWQYLRLPSEAHIRFAVESTCMIDDVKNHRACNPCGTFFIENGGNSRPEFMWRESNGKRKCILRRAIEGTKGDGREDAEDARGDLDSSKRNAFARTLSEVCEIDSKRKTPLGSSASSKRVSKKVKSEAESLSSDGTDKGRSKGKDRSSDDKSKSLAESEDDTPSASRDRDRSRHRSPPKCVYDFSKARLRDFVMDPHGRWRTKRSILENPSGRKVGRPAGIKTGEGEGRQRNNPHKKVEALLQAYEEMDKAKLLASQSANRPADPEALAPPVKRRPASKASTAAKSDAPTGMENGQMMDALQAILSASSPVQGHAQRAGRESNSNEVFAQPNTHSRLPHPPSGLPSLPNVNKTPSGMGAIRYGAPAHLMNSSPATAFQTVMDEADTDWKALFGFGGKSHVSAAVRRSPRKKPVGTHGIVNPYATSIVSPSGVPRTAHFNQSGPVEASALMQMTSSSPLTRNRVKSGQFAWAWGSSDDVEGLNGAGLRNGKVSSAITSPASPSPRRPRNKNDKRKADAMLGAADGGSSSQESMQRTGKQQKNGHANAAVLNAGPFMGLSSSDDGRVDDEDVDEEGPGSPTLGRSRRLGRKKNESRLNSIADSSSQHNTPMGLDLGLSSGMQASSSSSSEAVMELPAEWARATTMGELFPNLSPDKRWNAASPSQALWNSPTSWALRMPTPSPVKAMLGTTKEASLMTKKGMSKTGQGLDLASAAQSANSEHGDAQHTPGTLLQVQDTSSNKPSPKTSGGQTRTKRKPLPATVEDATPSDAIATPLEDGAEDYDEEDDDDDEVDVTAFQGAEGNALVFDMNNGGNVAELMKMFDDPYGFLAASGLDAQFSNNIHTASTNEGKAHEAPPPPSGADVAATSTATGSIGAMPSNAELAQMDLFKDFDFTQQLAFFNESSTAAPTASPNTSSRPLRTSPRKRNPQQDKAASAAV